MKNPISRILPRFLAAATSLIAFPASAALVYHYPLSGNFDQVGPGGTPVSPAITLFGAGSGATTPNWVEGIAPGSTQAIRLGSGTDNTRVSIAANDAWRSVTGFTVSAWIQPQANAGTGHSANSIFWLGTTGGSARFVLQMNDLTDLRAGGRRTGSESVPFNTDLVAGTNITGTSNTETDPLTLGQTYHVAATADYLTGFVTIYLNGASIASRQIEAWDPYGSTADEDFVIRLGSNTGGGEVFNGVLDDLRVYNNALSASEVAALAVPEPSIALLGAIGAIGLVRRRRLA